MTKPASATPWNGILAGAGAAVFYTFANICLRKLATEADLVVVVFVKAFTTAAIFIPWLWLIASKVDHVLPRGKYFWIMIFGAVQTQLFGNCGLQISFGIVGIAIAVPIYIGSLVASSALLGFLVLKENISAAVAISLVVLVSAVLILSLGGEQASDAVNKAQDLSLADAPFILGIVAAIGTGLAYAILGVCIRSVLNSGVPTQTPLVFVSLTGAIGFGAAMLIRDGMSAIHAHSTTAWLTMLAAGLFNAVAFLCLTRSLKLLPVVYVNAINVSQVAMAAAAGVLLFAEPLSVWLTMGLLVMIAGFVLLAHFSAGAHRQNRIEGNQGEGVILD